MDIKIKGGMQGMPQLPTNAPMFLIVPGIGLMLFGALIIYNPVLLTYIIAGLFLLLGLLLVMMGLRARKLFG